jgi:hypothetical protein
MPDSENPEVHGAPPKSLARQVRYLRHVTEELDPEVLPADDFEITETSGRALRLRGSAGIERTPKSLPVLQAFQEFLEAERRRSLRKMMFLTAFFAVVLIAVIAAGLFLAVEFMGRMRGNMDLAQTDAAAARQAASAAGEEAKSAATSMASETIRLRNDVEKDLAGFALASSTLEDRLAACTNRMADIAESVAMIERRLRGNLDEIIAPPHAVQTAPLQTPPASSNVACTAITLTIAPRDSDRPVRWRIPLPD